MEYNIRTDGCRSRIGRRDGSVYPGTRRNIIIIMKLYYSNHMTGRIGRENTSHLLLSKVMRDYYHIKDAGAILRTDKGKPYIPGNSRLCVSVTHTGTLWLCAVAGHNIGIDAEHLDRPVARPLKLAERYLSDGEFRFVAETPEDSARVFASSSETIGEFRWERIIPGANTADWSISERLLLIWTRKESLLKYTGEGLSGLTGSPCVMDDPDGTSIRSYRNGNILFSVCAGRDHRLEAISEYIDMDSGKVRKNAGFFKR